MALALAAGTSADGHVENYAEIVKAADWKAMKTITANMNEFEYDADLEFKAGQTYKLELKKSG